MKNIVIIGGGTGTFTLLSGLRKYPVNNSVIVSSADDGGSTGVLRKDLGVFPPGDVRQCLIGLSYTQEEMQKLFNFRFDKGLLAGHTAGNIIIAALEKITGNTEAAIEISSKMLNVRGQVLPVTLKPTVLSAILDNGKVVKGEHNIDEPQTNLRLKIKDLRLQPNNPANPKAIEAIRKADIVVFGPGDLYTSTLPNLLVKGVKEVIKKSKAQKVFITNIMTKYGQTDDFRASDFVAVLQKYLGGKIDLALINDKTPKEADLKKYAKEKAHMVEVDKANLLKIKVKFVIQDFLQNGVFKKKNGDKLKRSFLRHDSDKLAKIIYNL